MLQISNLTFAYHDKTVLREINLEIAGAGTIAVIGDNGTGKTTLLRLIAGELKPDAGTIKTRGNVGILHQTQDDLHEKSGGERTQIKLAELLRERPEILLLDEPTNNLDSESKRWLLENLRRYHGLVIFVSHDRDFINRLAEKIIYLHDGRAEIINGNYAKFQDQQAQELHEQTLNYDKVHQMKKKLSTQLKIAHDRAHKTNRRAFSKTDDESKLRYNGQRMGAQNSAGKILRATQSKLEQLPNLSKPLERKTYSANLATRVTHHKRLLETKGLTKSYGQKQLFCDLNLAIWTGERVRVTGRNGTGKSTLFRILMGETAADGGSIWLTPGLNLGYISQDKTNLKMDQSFLAQRPDFEQTEIYQAAVTMDLKPAEINKPVGELSRGQITKLAILQLILQPLDLVILDEITNHLDIRAQENIEMVLQNYQGAILAATHDETFAEALNFERIIKLEQVG